jgi:hypothetical protein
MAEKKPKKAPKKVKGNEYKNKFRTTKLWKEFRLKMRKERKVDGLTGNKLTARFNLHHCNPDDYENLTPEMFECLNKESHDIVEAFARKKNWRDCVDNLTRILEKMEQYGAVGHRPGVKSRAPEERLE